MLKIRLQRTGKKHDPSFRIVSVDSRFSAKSGKFLEILGSYDARKGTPAFKADRITDLISKGAQVSETVHNLLVSAKIISEPKKKVTTITKKKAAKVVEAKRVAEEAKAKATADKAAAKEAEKVAAQEAKEAEATEVVPEAKTETAEPVAEVVEAEAEKAPEAPVEAEAVV